MKKHFLKTMTIFGIAALGISAVAVLLSNKSLGIKAEDVPHSWNHYAAVTPTESTAGNKEYWVCCTHNEVVLTAPTEGTVTNATNPDFASVEAGTENNAAYLSRVQENTYNIGYTKMSKTGAAEETWEHVEGFDDVAEDFDILTLSPSAYGANFTQKNGDDTVGGSAVKGALKHVFDSNRIAFPRVDYTKYEYVKFSYGIDTWGAASLAASFGTNTEANDLHPTSTAKTGVLTMTIEDSKLKVTDTVGSSSSSVYVTDENVINGRESVVFAGVSADGGRTLFINEIGAKSTNHVHHYGSYVAASDRFGRKVAKCPCGDENVLPGDDVTAFTSYNQFGASGSFLSDKPTGQWQAEAPATGTIGYAYGNPGPVSKITLPKIDFKTSGRTILKFSTTLNDGSGDADRFELKYNGTVLHDMAKHGANYNMTMDFKYIQSSNRVELRSSIDDGTVYDTALINDQDIINGDKSLAFDFTLNGEKSYQVLGLNTILVNHTHSGNVKKCNNDVIGFKNVFCEVCGAHYGSSSAVTETSEIDIAHRLYGASISCVERDPGKCSITIENNAIKYKFGENNNPEHYKLIFPRVNYTVYDKVVFNLTETQGYLGLGFTQAQSDAKTFTSGSNAQSITIEITKVSNNEASAVFTYIGKEGGTDNYQHTSTITGSDVMNGREGLEFFGKSPYNNTENRVLNITSIVVTPSAH